MGDGMPVWGAFFAVAAAFGANLVILHLMQSRLGRIRTALQSAINRLDGLAQDAENG